MPPGKCLVTPVQLNCGGAFVLNAVSQGNAKAGGGAYINSVEGLGIYRNEWVGNKAGTGAGGVDFQSVKDAAIANDTYEG